MADIPIYQRSNLISADLPMVTPSTTGAELLQRFGDSMVQKAEVMQQQSQHEYALTLDNIMKKDLNDIDQKYAGEPEAMKEALDSYKTGFLPQILGDQTKTQMGFAFDVESMPILNRAFEVKQDRIDNSIQEQALIHIEESQRALSKIAEDLYSGDDAKAMLAGQQLQSRMKEIGNVMHQRRHDGTDMFSPSARVSTVSGFKDAALGAAGMAWMRRQKDPTAALAAIDSGQVFMKLPDGNGGFQNINVIDGLSSDGVESLRSTAKHYIAEQDAARSKQVAELASNLDLAISISKDPEQLNSLMRKIDESSDTLGVLKTNALKKSIFGKLKEETEKLDSIKRGSMFVSGDAQFNPADPEDKKAFNNYYSEVVEPKAKEMDIASRNTMLANVVTNARALPDKLVGDIQMAARSQNPEEVAAAADLIDRVSQSNPNLMQQLPQAQIARINLMNKMYNAGYNKTDAMTRVDEIMNPNNQDLIKQRTQNLSDLKVDYKSKAIDQFDPFFGSIDTVGTRGATDRAISALETDYRVAFESQYKLTGDAEEAESHAKRVVGGSWAVSSINGTDQMMKFAPERYYSIENHDNDWMRQQMVETAADVMFNSLYELPSRGSAKMWTMDKAIVSTALPIAKLIGVDTTDMQKEISLGQKKQFEADIAANVILVADPLVTPRTAKEGKPLYKIMLKTKDGTLTDILGHGKYFYPDVNKEADSLKAKAKKGIK